MLAAADAAAGEPVTHAHVGTEDGEAFAVRLGGFALVAAAERFALAGLDAVRHPRRAARSRPRPAAAAAPHGARRPDAPEAAPGAARPRLRLRRRGLRLPAPPPAHPPAVRARPRARRPADRAARPRPRQGRELFLAASRVHRRCPRRGSASGRRAGAHAHRLQPRGPAGCSPSRGSRSRSVGRALGQAGLARHQVRRVPAPWPRGRRRRALARPTSAPGTRTSPRPRSTRTPTRSSTRPRRRRPAPRLRLAARVRDPVPTWSASAPSGSRSSSPPTATSPTSGKYRVPLSAPVEGGANADGDRHVIAYDKARCKLYELYRAFPASASAGTPTRA